MTRPTTARRDFVRSLTLFAHLLLRGSPLLSLVCSFARDKTDNGSPRARSLTNFSFARSQTSRSRESLTTALRSLVHSLANFSFARSLRSWQDRQRLATGSLAHKLLVHSLTSLVTRPTTARRGPTRSQTSLSRERLTTALRSLTHSLTNFSFAR